MVKKTKNTEQQAPIRQTEHLQPWQFKPGQSGNPGGRPKGSSMKIWTQNYLATLSEEERLEFVTGMNKLDVWKMSEGNPKQDTEIKGNITISEVLDELDGPKIERQTVEDQPLIQDQKQEGETDPVQAESSAS